MTPAAARNAASTTQSSGFPTESVVRRLEVVVDEEEAGAREQESQRASACDAAAEHHEQKREHRGRLIGLGADVVQHPRDDHQHASPESPRGARSGGRIAASPALESVAHAGFRDDQLRARRIALDLASNISDVHAEILLRTSIWLRPDGVEELLMGERATARGHEGAENVPFYGSESDTVAMAQHSSSREVDRELPRPDRLRLRSKPGAEARRIWAFTRAASSVVLNGLVT